MWYNRLMKYNWQQKDWPDFKYDLSAVEDVILAFAEKVGVVSGIIGTLPKDIQSEAIIDMMVSEAMKTSEIEGEYLSRKDVMSSIKKNMGIHPDLKEGSDKRAQGISELMVAVRNSYADPLTTETLFSWHKMVMKGRRYGEIGCWRTHEEPMQVVSGRMGKEIVHYEAPPSKIIPKEMKRFIKWFNETGPNGSIEIKRAMVRSAIVHIYFETLHPFEDGNGRLGRALSEKALSQGLGRPVLLSLSHAIENKKSDYYDALEQAQKSNEITEWIKYFCNTVLMAQEQAEQQITFTLKKVKFFDHFEKVLNDRQIRVLGRMLEEGPHGFEGGMSAKKYMAITHTSKPTATRDMQDLVEKGVFFPIGEGRSRRYEVNIDL